MALERHQQESTLISTTYGRARSESTSTSGILTPTSSQCDSPCLPSGSSVPPTPDTPLPSIERGIETLGINETNIVVSSPDTPQDVTPSFNTQFEELNLGRSTSATSDTTVSLSPEPGPGNSSRRASHRRSTSRSPVQRHDVDQEDLPESDFYNRDFQNRLMECKDLARQLACGLSSSNLHLDETSAIHGLYRRAEDASNYCGPQNWKIGMVGDSGAGKSSLINSLLDIEGLARANNSGAACTCTVTEYHYHDSPTFIIEVVFFTKERLLEQCKELLQAYRRYHLRRARNEAAQRDLEEESAEERNLKEAASVAWHTFKAAFKNQPSLTEAYILEQNERVLLDDMSSWIDRSAPPGYAEVLGQSNLRREYIEDVRACSERLMHLTSEPANPNAVSSWPYIERVNVFLRANILSKGLIIVDLPGLRDTNSARKMITERYMVNCNEVFAIADIGRAITDAGVKAVIDLAERTRRQYVGIVCTKSDDIKPREAVEDYMGEARECLNARIRDMEACKEDLRDITNELQTRPGKVKEMALLRDRWTTEEEQSRYEYEIMQQIVTDRNNCIVDELRRKYQPTVENVHCISNDFYWKRRNDSREIAEPWLQLSNIILLRKHCLGLVASHQLQDASTFMSEVFPNIVSSIDLWVRSGSEHIAAETRAQVREAAKEVELILRRELIFAPNNWIPSALDLEFDGAILSRFSESKDKCEILLQDLISAAVENDRIWRTIASSAARSWNAWHHGKYINNFIGMNASNRLIASYAAFCRKYGDHTTSAVGTRCWNSEIINGLSSTLADPWRSFQQLVKELFETRKHAMERSFEQAINPLHAIDSAILDRENFDSVQTLITTISQRKDLLSSETLGITTEYGTALAQLGNADLLSGIRTSFIGQYMEPAYQSAAQDSGTGVDARRKALIRHRVEHPDVFNSIRGKVETRFRNLTSDMKRKILDANQRHFLEVLAALDILRNENAVLEAEQNPGFRERMRELADHSSQFIEMHHLRR